jgi:hypothetical protein
MENPIDDDRILDIAGFDAGCRCVGSASIPASEETDAKAETIPDGNQSTHTRTGNRVHGRKSPMGAD